MDKNVYNKLDRIEKIITSFLYKKKFLTIEETALYLDYSVAYIYKLTHLGTLPFYRPNGKKIFFRRTELDEWIGRHKCRSIGEIQQQSSHEKKD